MTSTYAASTLNQLESVFGEGREWSHQSDGPTAVAWETSAFHLLWCATMASDTEVRRLWEARKGHQAFPVVLLVPSDEDSRVRVSGPQDARPIRVLPDARVVELLSSAKDLAQREAAAFLAREFGRLEEAVVPGLRVKDLLTPHFLRDRLRWSVNQQRLSEAVDGLGNVRNVEWRTLLGRMGYQIEQLQPRGYLLRGENAPFAVVHAHADPSHFSRLTDKGELPEGMVLADAEKRGAQWGILVADRRFRIYQRRPPIGAATGQHVEIDTRELEPHNRFYLGLLAPDSLKENGWLTSWVGEAKDFGEQLRKGLEESLIKDALPNIARGLGEYLENQGSDLSDREVLQQIEEAALTLVFRFMFLLHTEARGYLPIGSSAYRPHSARQLAEDCRLDLSSLSKNSTQRWDRLRTLVRMVRTGDRSAGVPAYNGSLFAADGFPGGELLERAEITDVYLAPALAAITFDTDKPDDPGLDYAGLDVGHLGAIYERLLALKLTRAPEDLIYDARRDVFRPRRAGEQAQVTKAQLFYQSEVGGRKAGGVYYTRHEFVEHLLNQSLLPALANHLEGVRKVAEQNPSDAARRLFDFSVVDPAMGSAHFLTAALDMMADRIAIFLADSGGLPGIDELLKELDEDRQSTAPSPDHGDLLRRLILKRCIYGVDISPMAVEVANVTLWLASFVPGLALSYLGSNLKCGDALIGVADPSVVGASDSPMFTGTAVTDAMKRAADLQGQLAAIPDRTPEEVKTSEQLSTELWDATAGLRSAFDLWTAEPLGLDGARHTLETNADNIIEGQANANIQDALTDATAIAGQYGFFHWPLEFPNVFHRERPGFDVVVGNPPWNKVKFEMQSFLALHDPGIRGVRSSVERDKRANRLFQQRPELKLEIDDIKHQVEVQRDFYCPANGYAIQGRGDTDLYKLFSERFAAIAREQGYMGVVLPRVAFLNDGSRGFRRWIFKECRPNRIDILWNNRRWAFDMEPRYSIALTAAQLGMPPDNLIEVTGPASNEREFNDYTSSNGVQLGLAVLASWTPAPVSDSVKQPTWELPLLPTPTHLSILSKLRKGVRFDQLQPPNTPMSGAELIPPFPYAELHESNQRPLFNHPMGEGRISIWKGRSFDQYEPHDPDNPQRHEPAGFGDWDEILRFVQGKRMRSRTFKRLFSQQFLDNPDTHLIHQCRIAFRDSSRSTDSRTVRACLIPPRTPLTDTAPYIVVIGWPAVTQGTVLGVMNSGPFDWLARRYVENHLKYFILNPLTFPPSDNIHWRRIGELAVRLSCVDERFSDFAAEVGVDYGPLSDTQRNDMRAEIDALVARAYDLTDDELRFVFTDFTENAVSLAYRELVMGKFEAL